MASFQVLFGDAARPADAAFYGQLSSLEVEENADLPGAIQLSLPIATTGAPGSEDLTVVGDERFKPYARVAVVISIDGKPDSCIFDGYVLSHKIHIDRGVTAATVEVWGQDVSCLMNLEDKARAWSNVSDGNAANTIFGEYGFQTSPDNTRDDSPVHAEDGHLLMQRGTDAQFLRDRARRGGKLFRVCCDRAPGTNTGYFITPNLQGAASQTLTLNPATAANVDALDFAWEVARPTEVKAKMLVNQKDAESGDAQDSGLPSLDSRSLASFTGKNVKKAMLTTVTDDAGELQIRAVSLLREAGWFVRCEGEVDLARLDSVMRVGTLVQVNGSGRMHSGKYFVWSVRHTITAESHRLKFVLVRNAVGSS